MILIGVRTPRGSNTFSSIDNKSFEWINWRLTLERVMGSANFLRHQVQSVVVESRLIQMKLSIRQKAQRTFYGQFKIPCFESRPVHVKKWILFMPAQAEADQCLRKSSVLVNFNIPFLRFSTISFSSLFLEKHQHRAHLASTSLLSRGRSEDWNKFFIATHRQSHHKRTTR